MSTHIRSLKSINKCEIVFLILSNLGIFGVKGITLQRLDVVNKDTADFTFAIVLLINTVFCLYYVLSGVFLERPYELGVFAVSSIIVCLYIVINYAVSQQGPYKEARLIASSALSPFVIFLSFKLARRYHKSKSIIFRTVGAKPALQNKCQSMFLFFSLLNGELQICDYKMAEYLPPKRVNGIAWVVLCIKLPVHRLTISTAVLIMTSGQNLDTKDKIFLPLVIVLGVISFATGYLSVRYEWRRVMKIYLTLLILLPAYALFLIITSAKDLHTTHDNTPYSEGIVAVTFIAAGALLVLRVVTLFYAIKVFRNFGHGDKNLVF